MPEKTSESWVRDKGPYSSWHSKQHKLQARVGPLVPQVLQGNMEWPRQILSTQRVYVTAEKARVQETHIFQRDCRLTYPTLRPERDIIFILPDTKKICPLPWKETLFLSPKAICFIIFRKKDSLMRSTVLPGLTTCQNTKDAWRIFS